MNDEAHSKFYISLLKRDGETIGHKVSADPPLPAGAAIEETQITDPKLPSEGVEQSESGFRKVCRDFVSTMESYRSFISMMLAMASVLSASLAEKKIGDFVKAKGIERPDISTEGETVYELSTDCYREFALHNHEVITALKGARNLPEVMIIGLVSAYDAFLSQLLRVVLSRHEEIVLTSEKSIKFSELKEFSSIEQARASLIDREIDSVLRESHHEQFSWMESRFSVPLRKDLAVWPKFIELCERRNLLTHTGGIVADQYIAICKKHGVKLDGTGVGETLKVDANYFGDAVSTIYEIGVKLAHVLWRKFAKEEREEADKDLLNLGYDLISERAYPIAETLLRFGAFTLKNHASDQIRRMMIVNLANAVRLQKRESEAKEILKSVDWSAASDNFKMCVAAVNGDKREVLRLMRQIGPNGSLTIEDYRTWPVFRGMRTDKEFLETFEATFGKPLIAPSRIEIPKPEEPTVPGDDAIIEAEGKRETKH